MSGGSARGLRAPASGGPPRIISFLSDFGLQDAYVGAVKGVMLGLHPGLTIVDLTHQVPPQDVWEGAFQLMAAVIYFPPGTVHLAVVDPGVGTARRAVAVTLGGHVLVGPDNGLLSLTLRKLAREGHVPLQEREGRLPVVHPMTAVELTEPRFWRHPVSATFHARDVFGPAAAHLAAGVPILELGKPLEWLTGLAFPALRRLSRRRIAGQVVHVDRFGNLITNLTGEVVSARAQVRVGQVIIQGLQSTYGTGEGPVALIGSAGLLEVAVPGGDASAQLGVKRGDVVQVELG